MKFTRTFPGYFLSLTNIGYCLSGLISRSCGGTILAFCAAQLWPADRRCRMRRIFCAEQTGLCGFIQIRPRGGTNRAGLHKMLLWAWARNSYSVGATRKQRRTGA